MSFNWRELPQLTTPRLILRAIAPTDDADLFAIYSDPAVMQFASDPPYTNRAQMAQLRASIKSLLAERVSIEWGIGLNDRLVGTCGLHSFSTDRTQAEIGCLLVRAAWGQGIMTAALTAVIDFGFQVLALQMILAQVDARNERSLALCDRLGFHQNQPSSDATALMLTRLKPKFQQTFP
jgi:[ribosomal protein S5]-alanine N-acetyltransferase